MTSHPLTTEPSAELMKVLVEMSRKKIRRMPVLGNDKIIGIITKSDIYAALGPLDSLNIRLAQGKLNVGAYMTPDPVTIGPEAPLALEGAQSALADAEWTHEGVEAALRAMLEEQGLSVRKGLQPLRVALTGSSVSPPLFESIVAVGREAALARFAAAEKRLG